MRAPRAVPFLVGMVLTLAPVVASADAWLPPPGDRYSEFRAAHSSSGRYCDADGNSGPYRAGAVLEQREVLNYTELGWKPRVSLLFALPARAVTFRSDSLGGTHSETGFADLTLGARFRILDGPTALSLQAEWKAPLGYEHTRAPSLGSGQQDVAGHLNFGWSIPSLDGFLEVDGGYRYRFEEPPDQVEYSADFGFWIRGLVLLEGRYAGVNSVGADSASKWNGHLAGPRVTIRVDDRLDVFAGSAHLFRGTNIGRFNEYYAGVAFKRTRLNRLQGFLGGKRRP